jgi:hypothetical protein
VNRYHTTSIRTIHSGDPVTEQTNRQQDQLDLRDLQSLYDTFQGESDRGAAIVGAAYLEARLAELCAAFFTDDARKGDGSLKRGPLDSYAKRVTLAHWMGLISDDEHHDLRTIGKIRNRFAHKGHALSFSDSTIEADCAGLRLWKPLSEFLDLDTPRRQFLFTVTTLLMQLDMRVLHARNQRRAKPNEFTVREIVR